MADNLPSVSEFRAGRSDSTSSATSSTSTTSTAMPPSSTAAPRRTSSHHLFEGLEAQKRATDPTSVARRQSMSDQRPKSGFIGNMWNNWVHGDK